MWSADQLEVITEQTGLAPSNEFLDAAALMRFELPFLFEGVDSMDSCNPLNFHNALTSDFKAPPLTDLGFLPFWQENNHCETVLIGCQVPFCDCVAAQGILAQEDGGLLSGYFSDFFNFVRSYAVGRHDEPPALNEIICKIAYTGIFSSEVTEHADKKISKSRKNQDDEKFDFFGAMSEYLAMELLQSDDYHDAEVAAWRLGSIRSSRAVPELEKLAQQKVTYGKVNQHIKAARTALKQISGEQVGRFPYMG